MNNVVFGKLLGTGAFSKVYSGTHEGNKCAIKVVEEADKYFDNEVAVLAELNNRVYEKIPGWEYLVYGGVIGPKTIKYPLLGENLHQLMPDYGFDAESAAIIMLHTVSAVSALHTAGLIHTDIKLENIMKTTGSEPYFVLGDIGDCVVDGVCRRNVVGTVGCIAPEIILNQPFTEKADIYSLGILWYELLTGDSPTELLFDTEPADSDSDSDDSDLDFELNLQTLHFLKRLHGEDIPADKRPVDSDYYEDNKLLELVDECLPYKKISIAKVLCGMYDVPHKIAKKIGPVITKCLHWDPEKRPSAAQLLSIL